MASPGPSPCKLVEDSDVAALSPQPSGNQQALDVEDVIEFVEPLPNELQCPLCLEFLKEPTLTSCCGHHFCRECINRAITRSHVCPLCNNQGFQTFRNKEKERLVNALKVYCKWKSRGCEWVGELGRLEHHLDVEEGDCGCVEVECEFGPVGCVAKLPRKDLQRHKEENVHKHLVLMSVMSLKSNEAFVRKLQEQRVEFQQQLKQRDEEIQAIQESLHRQVGFSQELQDKLEEKQRKIAKLEKQLQAKTEQLTQVEGKLTKNARQLAKVDGMLQNEHQKLVKLERKQQEEKQEVNRQLAEVDEKVEEKGKELQTQFQRGNDQMDEEMTGLRRRIKQVEASLVEGLGQLKGVNEKARKLEKQLMTFIPPPVFTMIHFEQHKKDGDDWYSPPFYSHTVGYKMCLRVRAEGQLAGEGTHVSLYVHLMRGEHDDHLKWPFYGDITVQLLNQRSEEEHIKSTVHFKDITQSESKSRVTGIDRAGFGWGYSKFITHSALAYDSTNNTEYLRDDCLKFQVTNIKLTNV